MPGLPPVWVQNINVLQLTKIQYWQFYSVPCYCWLRLAAFRVFCASYEYIKFIVVGCFLIRFKFNYYN